jgi:hypothetical protein
MYAGSLEGYAVRQALGLRGKQLSMYERRCLLPSAFGERAIDPIKWQLTDQWNLGELPLSRIDLVQL